MVHAAVADVVGPAIAADEPDAAPVAAIAPVADRLEFEARVADGALRSESKVDLSEFQQIVERYVERRYG